MARAHPWRTETRDSTCRNQPRSRCVHWGGSAGNRSHDRGTTRPWTRAWGPGVHWDQGKPMAHAGCPAVPFHGPDRHQAETSRCTIPRRCRSCHEARSRWADTIPQGRFWHARRERCCPWESVPARCWPWAHRKPRTPRPRHTWHLRGRLELHVPIPLLSEAVSRPNVHKPMHPPRRPW